MRVLFGHRRGRKAPQNTCRDAALVLESGESFGDVIDGERPTLRNRPCWFMEKAVNDVQARSN